MKDGKIKISRQKGIEICCNLLFAGQSRKEIIQEITGKYKACESSIDKWIKHARPDLQIRQKEAERIMAEQTALATTEAAKRLNLTRERILEEYAAIAYFDIRKAFRDDGTMKPISELDEATARAIGGIESVDEKTTSKKGEKEDEEVNEGVLRKIKIWDKRGALDSICKVLGYNAPAKSELTGPDGGPIQSETTIKQHTVVFKKFTDGDSPNL